MTVSQRGAFTIAAREDLVVAPYFDPAKVETWGFGHTNNGLEPNPATMPKGMPADIDRTILEAWRVFLLDLAKYEREVVAVLGTLAQHELDGWVMWHINCGGIRSTKAVEKWKAGDKAGAVAVLKTWNKITVRGQKQVSNELVSRRAQEAEIILQAKYPLDATIEVYGTLPGGKVNWKPLERFSFDEWAAKTAPPPTKAVSPAVPVAGAVAAASAGLLGALALSFKSKLCALPWLVEILNLTCIG